MLHASCCIDLCFCLQFSLNRINLLCALRVTEAFQMDLPRSALTPAASGQTAVATEKHDRVLDESSVFCFLKAHAVDARAQVAAHHWVTASPKIWVSGCLTSGRSRARSRNYLSDVRFMDSLLEMAVRIPWPSSQARPFMAKGARRTLLQSHWPKDTKPSWGC